ncbi:MAG: glycosyltransferase family 4 protein [Propionibacteriaceae bacterium]|nr:glycosyltransferase family 4 protein [Propionibacteriaceae bacterium]
MGETSDLARSNAPHDAVAQGTEDPFDPAWYLEQYPDVEAAGMAPLAHYLQYGRSMGRQAVPTDRKLRRIVLVIPDLSTIGGISSRTRNVLRFGQDLDVEVVALTARSDRGTKEPGEICMATDPDALRVIHSWMPNDTAIVISNNALRAFPRPLQKKLQRHPIVYICAGQMAFMIQDSNVMADRDYAKRMRAMRIMSFSESDINFQRQLGIHGQVKGFAPVAQRVSNDYNLNKNRRLGYVGRIDFHAKDTARLIDVARHIGGTRWGPIKLFTTDGRNSPQYSSFIRMVEEHGLENQFEFVINCTDKEQIFSELAFLLVPSRKESFGNSIVESMSFGVPVIGASYAPGPAEIIQDGDSGFLLDEYTGSAVAKVVESITDQERLRMSACAFRRHRDYTLEAHVTQLVELCSDAIVRFRGENILPIFPELKLLEG